MKVGFTGSRHGMSRRQATQLQWLLSVLRHADLKVHRPSEFHYGTHEDAELKADDEAAKLAASLGYEPIPHHAARGGELARNHIIVDAVNVLLAAPQTDAEEVRSGTWATVRYARAAVKPVVMLSRGKR